jgi:hypothetical protein
MGMATYKMGSLAEVATAKINGTTMMNPAL